MNEQPLIYYFSIQFNELISQANFEQQQIKIYQDPMFEDGQIFSDKAPIILIRVRSCFRISYNVKKQEFLIKSSSKRARIY